MKPDVWLDKSSRPPNAGSPDPCQHWPFRGFRSCRVVRGPNSHRVTRVNETRYAIPSPEIDIASSRAEDSRSFSGKFGSESQIFLKKKKSTMLPQANRAVIGSKRPV
jgi:hypothetical protein